MFRKSLIVSFVFIFAVVGFSQNKSVYSDITLENCEGKSNSNVPGSYFGICKGVGGYDLEYYVNDSRDSLGVVSPSRKVFGLNFYKYFKNFSEVGKKAEWRMKNNRPFALIVRLNVSDQEDETKQTSYLIVSKISADNACVIDVVDPIKNQNAKARKIADKASTKRCMPEFSPDEMEEDPAINEMVGKDSGELIDSPDIVKRLKKLLGEKDYASFTEYFEVKSLIKREDDLLFASGCMTRACTRLESAFAFDVKNNTIHAAIFDQIEETKFFNENDSRTPEIIRQWAKRLENSESVEPQDEAILFDEFSYQNREDLMARFDAFVNGFYDDSGKRGKIVIFSDKKSYQTAEKEIKDYAALRGLGSERLSFAKGAGESKIRVQFWTVPTNGKPPAKKKSAETENLKLPKI